MEICCTKLVEWTVRYAKLATVLASNLLALCPARATIISVQLSEVVGLEEAERIPASRVAYYSIFNTWLIVCTC